MFRTVNGHGKNTVLRNKLRMMDTQKFSNFAVGKKEENNCKICSTLQ